MRELPQRGGRHECHLQPPSLYCLLRGSCSLIQTTLYCKTTHSKLATKNNNHAHANRSTPYQDRSSISHCHQDIRARSIIKEGTLFFPPESYFKASKKRQSSRIPKITFFQLCPCSVHSIHLVSSNRLSQRLCFVRKLPGYRCS